MWDKNDILIIHPSTVICERFSSNLIKTKESGIHQYWYSINSLKKFQMKYYKVNEICGELGVNIYVGGKLRQLGVKKQMLETSAITSIAWFEALLFSFDDFKKTSIFRLQFDNLSPLPKTVISLNRKILCSKIVSFVRIYIWHVGYFYSINLTSRVILTWLYRFLHKDSICLEK